MTDTLERLRQSLAHRYAVERELGSGGMALVFLARDLKHDRPVAIKVLRPELAAALGAERFLREIRLSASLHHPHILPLYDSGEVPPDGERGEGSGSAILYYVMPLVEGETLRSRLSRETQLPVEDALQIGREVADALGYAHSRDVVHRDIKPENILLESGHAIVADFGIARAITAAGGGSLTETGLAIGTPAYMSPEQASGDQHIDGRSDQYSLGCVMYEMLVGEPPYTGPTAQAIIARRMTDPVRPMRTVRDAVPEPVERAIVRALARVPADRFATAAQFVEALTATGPVARPAARWPRVSPRARRLALSAVAFVAVIAVGAYAVARARRPSVIPQASVIAVLPFVPSVPDSALARLGSDLMMTVSKTLNGVGEARTVDLYEVLTAASRVTPYAPAEAAALGRRFGAGSFVQGTITRDGADVRLDLGIYGTDTHVPLGPMIVVRASPDSLFALSDSISFALLRQIWLKGTPPYTVLEHITTRSIPALSVFLDGEREAAAGHWSDAAAAFHSAAQADTTFWVAGWRYYQALEWQGQSEDDDPRTMSYSAHLASFEPRDRAIIEAENTAAIEVFEVHLARFRTLAEEYPHDWVASFVYADHLVHTAPLTGHTKAEARKELERTVALNPALTNAWDHLLTVSLGQDSADARMALDGWARLGGLKDNSASLGFDVGLWYRLAFQLQSSGGRPEGILLDSVAGVVAASESVAGRGWGAFALVAYGYPTAQSDLDQLMLRRDPHGRLAWMASLSTVYSWVARGAWDSALVALDGFAASYPEQAAAQGRALDGYCLSALGAWLGGLDMQRAMARRDAALRYVNGLAAGKGAAARAMLAWADGVLAVLRSDQGALTGARDAVRHSHGKGAGFLDSSLAALELGLRGTTRAAANALALLNVSFTHDDPVPRDPYAIAINHLAAAKALLAMADSNRAIRELMWQEASAGGEGLIGHMLAGPAYLQLAQIEDAQGHQDLARFHYRQFLRRYDAPTPAVQALVTEARASLQRLGG